MSKTVEVVDVIKTESQLQARQIQKFFDKTPANKIYKRPAKGGGEWSYVKGSYVTSVLNSLFGYNWSTEVKTSLAEAYQVAKETGTVVVLVKLVGKVGDQEIVKEQFGRADVKYKKNSTDPLDIGNDFKAAVTDGKKKCANELGLFADVYAPEDFYDFEIVEKKPNNADKIDEIMKSDGLDSRLRGNDREGSGNDREDAGVDSRLRGNDNKGDGNDGDDDTGLLRYARNDRIGATRMTQLWKERDESTK